MDLSILLTIVLLVTPMAVELLHWTGEGGQGQPISMRVFRRGTMDLAQMKRPEILASAAEDMMFIIIWEMVRTGLLMEGTGVSSERMM